MYCPTINSCERSEGDVIVLVLFCGAGMRVSGYGVVACVPRRSKDRLGLRHVVGGSALQPVRRCASTNFLHIPSYPLYQSVSEFGRFTLLGL